MASSDMPPADSNSWVEDYTDDTEGIDVLEYDITAVPNDFNVLTIFNFIESGAVVIPSFQRNFIWDLREPHASLITSAQPPGSADLPL